jgi:hypothetical protein
MSSVALFAIALVMFSAGAALGITMVGRLGGAGWVMYAVVIGSYALVFGPMVAYAHGLQQRGSRRHRDEVRRRQEAQRIKYGLPPGGGPQ